MSLRSLGDVGIASSLELERMRDRVLYQGRERADYLLLDCINTTPVELCVVRNAQVKGEVLLDKTTVIHTPNLAAGGI